MERLLHHDAVDHMASVTRIAWLNGAFGATEEIDRLRQQRDEARRMVCGLDADIMEDQVEYAKHRGWDCFRKETNG
jgi:hypothetical protein